MEERLANEIMDAANNTGASVKKKEDMQLQNCRSDTDLMNVEMWLSKKMKL